MSDSSVIYNKTEGKRTVHVLASEGLKNLASVIFGTDHPYELIRKESGVQYFETKSMRYEFREEEK